MRRSDTGDEDTFERKLQTEKIDWTPRVGAPVGSTVGSEASLVGTKVVGMKVRKVWDEGTGRVALCHDVLEANKLLEVVLVGR